MPAAKPPEFRCRALDLVAGGGAPWFRHPDRVGDRPRWEREPDPDAVDESQRAEDLWVDMCSRQLGSAPSRPRIGRDGEASKNCGPAACVICPHLANDLVVAEGDLRQLSMRLEVHLDPARARRQLGRAGIAPREDDTSRWLDLQVLAAHETVVDVDGEPAARDRIHLGGMTEPLHQS
jgi:hypothetical protein